MENWEEAIDLLSSTRAFDHPRGEVTIDNRIIVEVAKLLTSNQSKDASINELLEALERIDQWDWPILLKYAEYDEELWDDLENVQMLLAKHKKTPSE